MKKKFISAILFGAFTLAATNTFVSCKDYDDDISNLQSQIDELSKKIDDINLQITNGSVITDVSSITNGIRITLSNKKSYDILNGTKGKDGSVVTIGSNGNWYIDGVDQGIAAKGENGATGATGDYYYPNSDGYFHKVTASGNDTATDISWKTASASAVYGVMGTETLTLYNVPNKEGVVSEDGIVIALSNNLSGLVFEKDNSGRAYIDGVPGIRVASFTYAAQTLANKDSQQEKATSASSNTVITPETYAYYHVNPSNANVEDLKNLAFVVKPNADYISTRANASSDFDATTEFVEFKDGILKVKVNVTGTPATDEKISVVALQATKGNSETVTSDYATIYSQDMSKIRLANKAKYAATPKVDYHYRRAAVGIDKLDTESGLPTYKAWSTQGQIAIGSDADLELQYDGSIDLNDYVEAHEAGNPCTIADLDALGLGIKYEIVQNYIIGGNKTDQKDFVTLEDGILTARVFSDASKKYAAVGRTPIVRATLYDKNNKDQAVEIAYIKVVIVKEAVAPKSLDLNIGNFVFDCEKDGVLTSSVEQINVQLYNEMNMDRDEFHNTYTYFVAGKDASEVANDASDADFTNNIGIVKELTETTLGETTHLLQWTLTPDEMWANADKDVTHVCKYYVAKGSNIYVKITLKAHINGIKKTYDVAQADFISEYWNEAKTQAKFNVAVPNPVGTTDNTKCIFVNDLNAPFTTTAGKLRLDNAITNFSYFFCKDIESVTKVGDIAVKFAVSANGLELNATVGGVTETVATIDNTGSAVPYNTVTLNKASNIAKQLLNTKEFEAYYGVKAYVCDNAERIVTVTFNGEDHFAALFVRPVNNEDQAADNFIDAVDFGEKGSYIDLKDLINPYDWRGRYFNDSNYSNYWDYYGPFTISVDETSMKCDLTNSDNPDGTMKIDVPATIEINQTTGTNFVVGGTTIATSKFGFLTYKNNGAHVKEFNLYIKVKIKYGWGEFLTDYITVPVKETIAQ